MDLVQVNMSTDDVLAWMQDRCDDRDDALQQIAQACQAGKIKAIGAQDVQWPQPSNQRPIFPAVEDSDGGKRAVIDSLEWIDKVPVYSDHHKYWVLVPPGWVPWQTLVEADEKQPLYGVKWGMLSVTSNPQDFAHLPLHAEPL